MGDFLILLRAPSAHLEFGREGGQDVYGQFDFVYTDDKGKCIEK